MQVTCSDCNYKFDLYREGTFIRNENRLISFLCSDCEVK